MERKIIQIAAIQATQTGYAPALYALCDDGSLFIGYDVDPGDPPHIWKALPNVPQPTEG